MAEVLGTVGVVIQLADCSHKLARTIRRFIRETRYAQQDAPRFVDQVQIDSALIRFACVALRRHCSDYPMSPVLRYLSRTRLLDRIDRKADRILESLRTADAKIQDIEGWRWKMRFHWALIKKSFLNASPELDGFKIDIQLILNTVQLELSGFKLKTEDLPQEERERLEQEIRQLQKATRGLVRTIKRLEAQLAQNDGSESPAHRKNPNWDGTEALLRLGKSMGTTGEIPRLSNPSSPQRSRGSSSRIMCLFKVAIQGHQHSRPSARTAEDEQAVSSSSQPMGQRDLESRAVVDTASDGVSRSGHLSRYLPERHISIDKKDFTRSTSGYVQTMAGSLVSATPIISPNLDINIISIREAHRFNLIVEPRDKKLNPIWFDDGTGSRQRVVGSLDLIWRKSNDMSSPPLILRCEVQEHSQSIVLGRSYLDAREKVRGKRKATDNNRT